MNKIDKEFGRRLQKLKKAELIEEVFKREWKVYALEHENAFLKNRGLWDRIIDTQVPL